jgi:hypothetical protein
MQVVDTEAPDARLDLDAVTSSPPAVSTVALAEVMPSISISISSLEEVTVTEAIASSSGEVPESELQVGSARMGMRKGSRNTDRMRLCRWAPPPAASPRPGPPMKA